MAISTKLLPRSVLAEFLPNPRAIRAFEDIQQDLINGGDFTGSVSSASIITLGPATALSGARTLTGGSGVTLTDGGAGNALTVSLAIVATTPLGFNPGTATVSIASPVPVTLGGHGQTTANAGLNALLPSQTGNGGKVLTTDGTNATWQAGGGGGGGSSAWSNGIGDRRALVDIAVVGGFGTPLSLMESLPSNSFYWPGGTGTRTITWTFPTANKMTGIGFYQDVVGTAALWTLAGSNDNVTYTDIITDYVLGGTAYGPVALATSPNYAYFRSFTNSTGYIYYRLSLNTGESLSAAPYIRWCAFKCEPIA